MKHPVFSFSALFIPFFIDFSHFSDQAAYFLLFIALFDFAVTFLLFYSFNVFFSLRHASLPLHLPGLPFSLFLRAILRFSQFSTLFILFLCFFHLLLPFFSSFSPFAASLACFFCFFVHPLLHLPLFSRFFPFLSSLLSFFLFFVYSAVSCPLFAIFQFFLHFFVSTYVTLPGSFFHVSHPSKCFTWNIVFHDFRSSAVSEKRFAFSLPENHSRFWSLQFLKQSYSISHFGFFRIFYIFPVFSHVSRVFLSLFSLFY